ncbi:homoserine kinase [Bifidobacterium choloepi]|uniref:Homoserine kinase n=1 Tax=Bifidobacterium choloepi TaxID=2614131 RepID=A0A6I5N9I5_9BIFI|nr:homoserine kinase [Bifidobacterium choloepi]NEG70461.1 homoserine kinase [Bifidobacterium choloepi]
MTNALPVCCTVHVRVPATSANLGSGFDAAGLALEYFDELTFTWNGDLDDSSAIVAIHGEGEDTLPRDGRHLVVKTFRTACKAFGLPKLGFALEAENRIPQARGMGSSAEAIVAGVAAAAAFAGLGDTDVAGTDCAAGFGTSFDVDRDAVFALAAGLEGHPDNVAPAVYGSMTVSWNRAGEDTVLVQDYSAETGEPDGTATEPLDPGFRTVNYAVADTLRATVFVPDFELSTEKARHALPSGVPFADATFNLARSAMLPAAVNPAVTTGDDPNLANALLFDALDDKLHQPYRLPLMEPTARLVARLRAAGFAASVSGAGPCALVLAHGDLDAAIDDAAAPALSNGHWKVLHLPVNRTGVQVSIR